jgi:serine protease
VKFRLISAIAIAALSMLGIAPAQAATTGSMPTFDFVAGDILVKYAAGVSAVAANGEATGENSAQTELTQPLALGNGWYKVSTESDASLESTWSALKKLDADPRIESVDVNRVLIPSSVSAANGSQVSPSLKVVYAAIKPASAPRSLKAADAFVSSTPAVARVKLTWAAPSSLGSAKLVGYRISYKKGTDAWKVLVSSTKSKATTYTVAKGLVAATAYQFQVTALTQAGSVVKAGAPSAAATATATTAPTAPLLMTAINITSKTPVVTWVHQTPAQAGATDTTYTVTATATTGGSVSCTSTTNSCEIAGLSEGVTYKVAVVAKNKRGSAQSAAAFLPQDAYYAKQWFLWGEHGINAPGAWISTLGSKNTVVAVLDTGITRHPDLDSQVIAGYDFVSAVTSSRDGDAWDADATDPGDYAGAESSSWHGTHVAGIIGAASNTLGVIGVAPGVKIQPIRVLGAEGGTTADLVAGLRWAAGLTVSGAPLNPTPAKVINISMGTDSATPCRLSGQRLGVTEEALAAVKAAGVTTITAAGNFNMPAAYSYPGNCYPTLNVGATNFSGDRAVYSNYSVQDASTGDMVGVDLSAPGGDHTDFVNTPEGSQGRIISTRNAGTTTAGEPSYDYEEGTSMSSPIVAGVVALVYSIKPNITFDDVWLKVISPSLTPFAEGTQCAVKRTCGAGIISASAAVALAISLP